MGREGVRTKDHLLTEEEIRLIEDSELSEPERLTFTIMVYTGMRVGEFLHFRNTWIDWKAEEIKIPAKQQCRCRECMQKWKGVWSPKTELGIRTIYIFPEYFPSLYSQLKKYFVTDKHESIMDTIHNRGMAWHYLEQVRKRTGINHKLFPHVLRGSYATLLARCDVKEFSLLQIMGWGNIKIAQMYIRLAKTDVKRDLQEKLKGRRVA